MASNTTKDGLRNLIQHAIDTQHIVQATCGSEHDLTSEIANLYCILRRLQREILNEKSPLHRHGDTCKEELKNYSKDCAKVLRDIDDFLTKYRELCNLKKTILQSKTELPLSAVDKEVLNKFRSDLIFYGFQLSQLTVNAAMDSLGDVKDHIDNAGCTLRFVLNTVAARMLAENKISIFTEAEHLRVDMALWEELHQALIDEGLASSFVKEHRKPILAYIKALERRTAFEGVDPPSDDASNDGSYNRDANNRFPMSDNNDACGTNFGKFGQDDSMPPLSRKRTRSNEEWSPKSSKMNSFESSNEPSKYRGFRFSDPKEIFQKFMEREGAWMADDEILTDFLNEKPWYVGIPANPRDQIREIYRKFCNGYEHRCETLLEQRSGQDSKDNKEYLGLIHDIDKIVTQELDGIYLGNDDNLHGIRRKIIVKLLRTLERLEAAAKEC